MAEVDSVDGEDIQRVASAIFQEEGLTAAVIAERELGSELEAVLKI